MQGTHITGIESQLVSKNQSINIGSSSELVAALAETREARERHIVRLTVYRQERQGPWRKVANLHLVSGSR